MKRKIYISAFILLGILLQFLAHALIEIWYLGLLLQNFDKYGFGFSWKTWFAIHHLGSAVLFAGGAFFGFLQGKYWWRRIYEGHAIRRFFLGF